MNPLKLWFARQSLTVKLLLTIPVLLAAVLWSLAPDDATPVAPSSTNRPVLSADSPAAQATIAPHQEPASPETGLTWTSALRTVVSVVVVVGLIVAGSRGLKYVMANTGQLPGAGGSLKVVETTYLPSPNGRGRAAIHVLETTDGRQFLVGATDTQLSLLAEFEDTARLKTVAGALDEETQAAPRPSVLLDTPEPAPDVARFDEVLDRLRRSARALERAG